jgi:hypothetical protein
MKYTETRVRKICEAVAGGLPFQQAAALGGINRHTIAAWRNAHPEFADALEQAESDFIQHHIGNIETAADSGQWQASAWLLERKYPALFALRAELRLGQGEEPADIDRELEEIMASSPEMTIDLHRAIEEERSRIGGNGNGRG